MRMGFDGKGDCARPADGRAAVMARDPSRARRRSVGILSFLRSAAVVAALFLLVADDVGRKSGFQARIAQARTNKSGDMETYEVFAIKYATRDAVRSSHFIGGDPHDAP